jgi:hypothetical protein
MLSMGGIDHITRFRAPYGEPFQTSGAERGRDPGRGGQVRRPHRLGHGVDRRRPRRGRQEPGNGYFIGKVTGAIGSGPGQGSPRRHPDARHLPLVAGRGEGLLDPTNGEFKKRGFRVGTVEDAICWKYGKHSGAGPAGQQHAPRPN